MAALAVLRAEVALGSAPGAAVVGCSADAQRGHR